MKVSVIIFYNKDRGWLKDAIESVKTQDYKGEIELIQVFDPKGSAAQNLNAGIEAATGDYIKYLGEDDQLTPNCISDSVKTIEKGFDFIHGNAITDWGNKKIPYMPPIKTPTLKELVNQSFIHGATLFYRADILKKYMIDETLDCAEEYDLNMKLLKNGHKIGYCDSFLCLYRRHDNQKSLGKGVDQTARTKRIKAIKDRYR